jgi:3-methyladenine DNA glycosylase AlkD
MEQENKVLKIKEDLWSFSRPEKISILQRFFKTGKGQYGEGDIFMGVMVPDTRKVAIKYKDIDFESIKTLLYSKVHEERLCALLILVEKNKKTNEKEKKEIFNFYIKHSKQANNWDLVDLSAVKIVGEYLFDKDKSILYDFAESKCIWQRRISVIATFCFIKSNKFTDALKIARILLKDKEELIHKAVGWMLREVGKRNLKSEEDFLQKNFKNLPRVTLRYSIEKFPEDKRKKYLKM